MYGHKFPTKAKSKGNFMPKMIIDCRLLVIEVAVKVTSYREDYRNHIHKVCWYFYDV